MLVRYGAVSQYGVDIPIAVMGIESKVFTVVINIVVGIVLGCQPIIGYNIGARQLRAGSSGCSARSLLCTVAVGLAATLAVRPRAARGGPVCSARRPTFPTPTTIGCLLKRPSASFSP